ncbi:MAG: hypothetical protein GY705_24210 [Bacteroidetes bacterium]|nr:hypothetical protein [Bacteroidota bacterium]
MESKTRSVLGAIIAVCAIGMIIIEYATNGDMDSYMMSFILLCASVVIFANNSKKEKPQKEISEKQQKIILSIALVTLVAGIITFCTILF